LFGVFKVLPVDSASALGGALARCIGPFFGVSKQARRNISRAFPELSEPEIKGIVAGMWDNLGRVAAEYPHLRKSVSSNRADSSRPMASNMWLGRLRLDGA
jgi:KDO2-lipid IV(A) lauroyltransferase